MSDRSRPKRPSHRIVVDRRALLTAPILLAARSALAHAALTGAPSTEEFRIPARDNAATLYLRNKRAAQSPGAAARTILFVHGLTYASSAVFDLPLEGQSWMDHLAAQGFDVWCLDIRGFGRSTKPAVFDQPASQNAPYLDAATAVGDVTSAAEFISARRGMARLIVLAWSWGTVLAAAFAAQNPQMVEHLVLYAPIWRWGGRDPVPSAPPGAYRTVTRDGARAGWLSAVPDLYREKLLPAGWFDQWAAAVFATDPEGARMSPPALRVPNGPLVEVVHNWKTGNTFFDPAALTVPVQLVVAEWDHTTPPDQALALFPLLKNATARRLVILPEGTHSLFLERNRAALFSTVDGFLDGDPVRC